MIVSCTPGIYGWWLKIFSQCRIYSSIRSISSPRSIYSSKKLSGCDSNEDKNTPGKMTKNSGIILYQKLSHHLLSNLYLKKPREMTDLRFQYLHPVRKQYRTGEIAMKMDIGCKNTDGNRLMSEPIAQRRTDPDNYEFLRDIELHELGSRKR